MLLVLGCILVASPTFNTCDNVSNISNKSKIQSSKSKIPMTQTVLGILAVIGQCHWRIYIYMYCMYSVRFYIRFYIPVLYTCTYIIHINFVILTFCYII